MDEVTIKILTIISIFIFGFLLKTVRFLNKEDADFLLKFVVYISLPAQIMLTVPKTDFSESTFLLLLIPIIIVIFTYILSNAYSSLLGLNKQTKGVFIFSSMIMNIGFVLPFVLATYGDKGLSKLFIFDFANILITFTFTYYIACKHGTNNPNMAWAIKKILYLPPIWALMIAFFINISNISLPSVINNAFQMLAVMLSPMIMIALGVHFSPRLRNRLILFSAIVVRQLLGFFIGFVLIRIFSFDQLTDSIILLAASAPVGFNTLVFSSLENLDKEFAADLVSISILVGLILTPMLL